MCRCEVLNTATDRIQICIKNTTPKLILMYLQQVKPFKDEAQTALFNLKTQSLPRCKHFSSRL
jgi:hypothetical protein